MAVYEKKKMENTSSEYERNQLEKEDAKYAHVKSETSAATQHDPLPPPKHHLTTALQIPRPNKPHRTSSASSYPSLLTRDDFDQLQLSRSDSRNSNSREHPKNITEKETANNKDKSAFWARNKGIVAMLVSQFFGTLMGLTTRFLELEGEGMHPFQVGAILFPLQEDSN